MDYVEILEKENLALQEKVEELQSIVDSYCDNKLFKKDYEVIPWWKRFFKEDNNLHFYLKQTRPGPYESSIYLKRKNIFKLCERMQTQQENIWCAKCDFLRGIRFPAIRSFYKGFNYPVFDCDNEKDKIDIEVFLDCCEVSYSVFETGHKNHYWIVCDLKKKKIKDCIKFVYEDKAGDSEYKKIVSKDKMFLIRACKKHTNDYPPRYVGTVGGISYDFEEFINKISDYFNNSREFKIFSELIKCDN